MEATIETKAKSISELMPIKNSLQTIAENVSKENLAFLAEISKKPGFNDTLKSKQGFIKTFL